MPAQDRPDSEPSGPLAGARVLLAVCGGIAAYKAAELARELMRHGAEVQPMLREGTGRLLPLMTSFQPPLPDRSVARVALRGLGRGR